MKIPQNQTSTVYKMRFHEQGFTRRRGNSLLGPVSRCVSIYDDRAGCTSTTIPDLLVAVVHQKEKKMMFGGGGN